MPSPTPVRRAARWALPAVIGALLVVPLVPTPARAASSVEIEVRALVGGRYVADGWIALAVTMVNEGEPTDGHLVSASSEGSVRRFVEMPAGARKVVMLYLQPDPFQREVEVRYEEPNGTVPAVVDVGVFNSASTQYAVVGDATGTLRPQLMDPGVQSSSDPIPLAPVDIPERPEPLDGLTGIVWAGDSSGLNEAQRRSLQAWVADGGHLVVLGGADWQTRTAALADLLPLTDLEAADGVPIDALAGWAGNADPPVAEETVARGALRDDARALVIAGDGTVLASLRPIGAGRVVFVGVDLATNTYRGWESSTALWSRLAPDDAVLGQLDGGGIPMEEEFASAVSGALDTLPSLDVPPAELLLAVIVGYIVLIGPVSYLVLRRADRRELAWVTAPLLVVLFSASSFGIGRSLKGSDVIVNQVVLLRTTSAGGSGMAQTFAGVYSPDRATFDLAVEGEALFGRLRSLEREPGADTVAVEQGDPARMRDLAIGVSGFQAVRASAVVDLEPALEVSWRTDDGDRVGTITNVGDEPLADVAFISPAGGEMVGDLEPGESTEFTIPAVNFNGTAASDQVYGFGGFDATSEEQRQIQVRRRVIDALVGYGAFGGVAPDVTETTGRGPYVIGWRSGDGPTPVTVEGQERVRRYGTVAEVLATRPTVATGPVTVRPHQMAISVQGFEGEAGSGGPGTAVLADGSAVFVISLPLEATGLEATEVEIVAAPDAHTLATDAGAIQGWWPVGYTVEVRDPASGEWMTVGDLGETSRFRINDPAAALSGTGHIEVRVTGRTDPDFGAPNVMVSAVVRGVIGE